jgi:hypothetical protein
MLFLDGLVVRSRRLCGLLLELVKTLFLFFIRHVLKHRFSLNNFKLRLEVFARMSRGVTSTASVGEGETFVIGLCSWLAPRKWSVYWKVKSIV